MKFSSTQAFQDSKVSHSFSSSRNSDIFLDGSLIDHIEKISKENIQNFNINLMKRKKDQVFKNKTTYKAEVGEDWYCYYSDNIEDEALFENKQIVVTIHGFPG